MIDYNQYLLDVPRIYVYIDDILYKDTPIELINILKRKYKRHYKFAANLCTQQTLSNHYNYFIKRFNNSNMHVVDGGAEKVYFNKDSIKIYKPFNLVHIYKEEIVYTIYLRIVCSPTKRTVRSFWRIIDTNIECDYDREWSVIQLKDI